MRNGKPPACGRGSASPISRKRRSTRLMVASPIESRFANTGFVNPCYCLETIRPLKLSISLWSSPHTSSPSRHKQALSAVKPSFSKKKQLISKQQKMKWLLKSSQDNYLDTWGYGGVTSVEIFLSFVNEELVPRLLPGDVVVMDNLGTHHATGARAAIEITGARVVYLSPYSPDLNPIELCWSKVKSRLRSSRRALFPVL